MLLVVTRVKTRVESLLIPYAGEDRAALGTEMCGNREYPIARVSAKICVGMHLELLIQNTANHRLAASDSSCHDHNHHFTSSTIHET